MGASDGGNAAEQARGAYYCTMLKEGSRIRSATTCPSFRWPGPACEGKPHVRFEVVGDENQDRVKALRHSQRKPRATGLPCLDLRHHPL